jgi:predicted Zn-dependent protease with MMP-like domain
VYALVVCDVGSRLVDAVPMQSRDSKDLKIAFRKLYKKKILSIPRVLTTDAGTEFCNRNLENFLESMGIHHNIAKVGSHRSVSLAERKNMTIGKIIHKIILKVELVSKGKNSSSQWVQYLPNIIALINKKVHESFEKIKKNDSTKIPSLEPTFNPAHNVDLLNVGQKVRVALDNPLDIHGKPKYGGFRSSDHRWGTTIRTVKFVLMKPNELVMYLLDGKFGDKKIECTGYTRNRLQKVSTHEANNEANAVAPVPIEEDRFEFEKILERKKTGDTVYYLIKWKGYHKKHATWEKRSELIKDIPQAVLNYEKKNPVA